MKVKLILGAAIVILGALTARSFSQEPLETGQFSVGGKLELDLYFHKLGEHWFATKSGTKGISYDYSFYQSSPTDHSWETVFGQTLFIDVGAHPVKELTADLGFEVIGQYADRYWLPINYEHRLYLDNKNFAWTRADIRYTRKSWDLRYFRGIGHSGWGDEGDLFDLYLEQYSTREYLDISGRPIPEGFGFSAKGKYGKLDLVAGQEVNWDYRSGIYAHYAFNIRDFDSHVFYRDHIIPYGEPDERMRSIEGSTRFDVESASVELGLLYQPFRLNRAYTYVEEVAPGAGLLDTNLISKTGTTGVGDAFGASGKVSLKELPYVNDAFVQYTYRGLVAGNKQELNTDLTRKFTRSITGSFDFTYRKPLIGPVPLVFEGTPGNTGPALFQPRGPESPFWVGWASENQSLDWRNREASLLTFTFTYDPTPGTWFYRYRPNILEEYNLNPDENAHLSCAAQYTLARYPSSTDRLTYLDQNGTTLWEPPLLNTPWPTDGYIGAFKVLTRHNIPHWQLLYELSFGESLAYNSFAYTLSTFREKPITGFFSAGVTAGHGPYQGRVRYGNGVWGPYAWHRQFGEAFDELYQAGISRRFGESITAGLDYVGTREHDKKYIAPELGDYDEIRAYFTLAFGPFMPYLGSQVPETAEPVGESPEIDAVGPQVGIKVSSDVFVSGSSRPLVIEPWAMDMSGIREWKIEIKDERGLLVKTIAGDGQPPFSVEWNGTDDIYGKPVPDGKYLISLTATDSARNQSVSDPVPVAVTSTSRTIIREIVREVPKDATVKETERGLEVSFTSSFLFDYNRSDLKPGAGRTINNLVKVLNAYPKNRLSVEGHTDNIGSNSYNQKLSERRAWSVADQLIKAGVSAERIKVVGYGEDKPIASNAAAAGREANRRVEVIILK